MHTEPHTPVQAQAQGQVHAQTEARAHIRPRRRTILRSAAALSGLTATAAAGALPAGAAATTATGPGGTTGPRPPRGGTELILLGTAGGPVPMRGRSGIASVLLVEDRAYLVDCGPGTFCQYDLAGLTADRMTAVFITHLHSDHLADLHSLLWLRFGGYQPFTRPVHIYGPA
ncbi:MBL fold metallo-hydrolase, partial [Streptomyces sp. GC420]|uniref:MBL fold metallo-hydrolase n=1 Tax=Streptomyces sp. GC420 TaxID=2697568 RepID=UPI001414D125